MAKGETTKRIKKVRASARRGRVRLGKLRARAKDAAKWVGGDYVCVPCQVTVRERDRKRHEEFHRAQAMVLGAETKRENQIAKREREERKRRQSRTVQQEQQRRGNARPAPEPLPPMEDARTRARKSWAQQVDQRSTPVAAQAPPPDTNKRVHPHGPAGHIQAAARMLVDFQPLSHAEQKELALSMNVVLGELAKAVEAYQENRVRERFHPNCIRPLDLVVSGLMEIRAGWVHMILAIERHYAAHFEAARQGGPVPGQAQGQPSYFDEAAG